MNNYEYCRGSFFTIHFYLVSLINGKTHVASSKHRKLPKLREAQRRWKKRRFGENAPFIMIQTIMTSIGWIGSCTSERLILLEMLIVCELTATTRARSWRRRKSSFTCNMREGQMRNHSLASAWCNFLVAPNKQCQDIHAFRFNSAARMPCYCFTTLRRFNWLHFDFSSWFLHYMRSLVCVELCCFLYFTLFFFG